MQHETLISLIINIINLEVFLFDGFTFSLLTYFFLRLLSSPDANSKFVPSPVQHLLEGVQLKIQISQGSAATDMR